MNPEIYLIRAYGRDDGFRCIPWGIVNIASYLKKYGHKLLIADRKEGGYSLRGITREIKGRDIVWVGISAMTCQSQDAAFLCGHLRKMNKNIILGGLHYSIFPDEGLKIGDYVFKGEAEQSLLGFLQNGPSAKVYEPRPLSDLDDIPLPDEELLKRLYVNKSNFTIMTSRGCPYACSFCLDRKYRPEKIRYHSASYVCDLMEMMHKLFGVTGFFIGDDVFTLNKNRAMEICGEIRKRRLKVKMGCFTHSGIDDLELYREMEASGFSGVSLGVESGCDEVLKAMNKHQTVAQTRRTIEVIKKSGLQINVMYMVGNILETEDSLKATLELARELRLNGWVSYAQPFAGTTFREGCLKYGRIINKSPATYWNDRISFVPRGLSARQLRYYRDKIAMALKAPVGWRTRILRRIIG